MNDCHLPSTSNIFKRCALASAIGLTLGNSAFAQTSGEGAVLEKTRIESTEERRYKVEQMSSPKYTQPILDTAATQYVLTEQLMDEQSLDSLEQALHNVPGITLAAGEGGTNPGDNISIRGFDSSENIYVDGVRDTSVYSRDIYNLEQLEVTLGPSSSYSGRGSTGGSVNMVTKKAMFKDSYRATLKAGNADQRRATVDVNKQFSPDVGGRLNLLVEDSGVPGRDVVENKSVGVAPSLAMQLSDSTRLDIYGEYLSQDNIPDYGIPLYERSDGEIYIPDTMAENFYGLKNRDTEKVDVANIGGKITHRLSPDTTITSTLKYAESDLFYVRTPPRLSHTDPENFARRDDIKTKSQERDVVSSLTDLRTRFHTGSVKHDLNIGLELTREHLDQFSVSVNSGNYPVETPLFNPDPSDRYVGSITDNENQIKASKSDTYALYAFDTLTLNPYWKFTGGLRLETFDLTYSQNYSYQGWVHDASGWSQATINPFERNSKDTMLSWNASVVFKPAANGSIYLGTGSAFTPAGNSLTLDEADSQLDPERSVSYELGTKWDVFDGRLLASAAIFRTVRTNAQTVNALGDGIVLDGEQRVNGIEASLTGNITEALQLQASATVMDSEVSRSNDPSEQGQELALTPDNTLSLWAKYAFNDALQVGAGLEHMGEYAVSDTRYVPSHQTVQLMASYQLNDFVSLQLNGKNLTDERYISASRPGGHAYVGDGRSITLSANVSF